jgi:hypothetical protein
LGGNALYNNKPLAIGDISRCHRSIKLRCRNLKGLYISNKSFSGHDVMKGYESWVNDMSNDKKYNQGRHPVGVSSISKLFKEMNFALIATLMKDGSPQVTPTWVDIDKSKKIQFW